MLDGNAGMIRNYAEASLLFNSREYERIVRKSVQYVRQNLYDPASGALFGSQDADETYYKARNRKTTKIPGVDRTVYTDSSALMISALVSAYDAVGEKQYLDMAMKSADYLLTGLFVNDAGFFHFSHGGAPMLDGLLSDNVLAGTAFLDLYGATGENRYLNAAKKVSALIKKTFYDPASKRFRSSLAAPIVTPLAPGVLSRVNDNLANYRAVRFLGRMLSLDDLPDQRKIRDEALLALSTTYQDFTPNAAAYGNALLWAVGDPIEITIVAKGKKAQSYLAAIRGVYVPKKSVRVLSIAEDGDLLRTLGYSKQEAVYLCAGKRCAKPVKAPGELKEQLKRFLQKGGKS